MFGLAQYSKINYFEIIKDVTILTPKFYADTVNRPWMRIKIFFDDGPLARTPEHYKKFFYDWKIKTPLPVHYIPEKGNWKIVNNNIIKLRDVPIRLIEPFELHKGIWGGEAVVKGFTKRKPKLRAEANYWTPRLQSTVIESEILNKYMKMVVTERALRLMDDNYGFDNYILNTAPADLVSLLALKLRRDMIYAILTKTLCPQDLELRNSLYEKHKHHIIPEEELEWYGLTLAEANWKQKKIEEKNNNLGPFKHIFRQEFIQHLKDRSLEATVDETELTFVSKLKINSTAFIRNIVGEKKKTT